MSSGSLIIWLTGAEYPDVEQFGTLIFENQNNVSQIQSLIASEMGELITRSADFKSFQQIPAWDGESNLLLNGNAKTALIICCSRYSSSQFYKDISTYSPDLTIFVRQPKGISRANVSKVAQLTEKSLMAIQLPKIIVNNIPQKEDVADFEDSKFVKRIENNLNFSSFLFETPDSKEKLIKRLKNISSAIFKIAKFTGNLLEAWNRGCKLFDLAECIYPFL